MVLTIYASQGLISPAEMFSMFGSIVAVAASHLAELGLKSRWLRGHQTNNEGERSHRP